MALAARVAPTQFAVRLLGDREGRTYLLNTLLQSLGSA